MKLKGFLAVLLAAALICSLTGCGILRNIREEAPSGESAAAPETEPENVPETESEAAPVPEPEQITAAAAMVAVSDKVCLRDTYMDDAGNVIEYRYRLPVLHGSETEYTAFVNSEMEALRERYILPELRSIESGLSIITLTVDYQVAYLEGVTSLLVYMDNDYDMSSYRCYNVRDDGSEVSSAELLELKNASEEAFLEAARAALTERTNYAVEGMSAETAAAMKGLQDQTVSEENCNMDMPVFLNADGALCFVGHIYTPAGAGEYDYLMDTGL